VNSVDTANHFRDSEQGLAENRSPSTRLSHASQSSGRIQRANLAPEGTVLANVPVSRSEGEEDSVAHLVEATRRSPDDDQSSVASQSTNPVPLIATT